jgi:hypothetical protein
MGSERHQATISRNAAASRASFDELLGSGHGPGGGARAGLAAPSAEAPNFVPRRHGNDRGCMRKSYTTREAGGRSTTHSRTIGEGCDTWIHRPNRQSSPQPRGSAAS